MQVPTPEGVPQAQQLTSALLEVLQRMSRTDIITTVFDYSWLVTVFPGIIVLPAAFFMHPQPVWIVNKYNKLRELGDQIGTCCFGFLAGHQWDADKVSFLWSLVLTEVEELKNCIYSSSSSMASNLQAPSPAQGVLLQSNSANSQPPSTGRHYLSLSASHSASPTHSPLLGRQGLSASTSHPGPYGSTSATLAHIQNQLKHQQHQHQQQQQHQPLLVAAQPQQSQSHRPFLLPTGPYSNHSSPGRTRRQRGSSPPPSAPISRNGSAGGTFINQGPPPAPLSDVPIIRTPDTQTVGPSDDPDGGGSSSGSSVSSTGSAASSSGVPSSSSMRMWMPSPAAAPARRPRVAPLKCEHCSNTQTPKWRAGPNGPNTLCNSCGLMWSKKNRQRKSEANSPITSPTNPQHQQTSPSEASVTSETTSSPLTSSADGFSPENPDSLNNSGSRPSGLTAQIAAQIAAQGHSQQQQQLSTTSPSSSSNSLSTSLLVPQLANTHISPSNSEKQPVQNVQYSAQFISCAFPQPSASKSSIPVHSSSAPQYTFVEYPGPASSSSNNPGAPSGGDSLKPPVTDEAAVYTPSFLQTLDAFYCDPQTFDDPDYRTHLTLSGEDPKAQSNLNS